VIALLLLSDRTGCDATVAPRRHPRVAVPSHPALDFSSLASIARGWTVFGAGYSARAAIADARSGRDLSHVRKKPLDRRGSPLRTFAGRGEFRPAFSPAKTRRKD
jgi:hypothetical protein